MNYRTQKFLALSGVFGVTVVIASIAVGDFGQGFILTVVGYAALYAIAKEITK
ncbi:hypothetical protein [Arthrobacter koreensis]|uniref:hypothetical protein n=1 Tax=Arthrobacter koreensis TaxID=199136 RepID=UPI0038147753